MSSVQEIYNDRVRRDLLEMTVDYFTDSQYMSLEYADAKEGEELNSWIEVNNPKIGHFKIEFEIEYAEWHSEPGLFDCIVNYRVIEYEPRDNK
jgi:hypothetical protein